MTGRFLRWGLTAGAGAVFWAVPVAPLAAQEVSWSGSIAYTRGDYVFTERTDSWSFLNSLTLRQGRARVGVGLPLILQNSTALTWLHGSFVPTGGPDHGAVRRRESGERVRMGNGSRGSGPGSGSGRMGAAAAAADSTARIAGPSSYRLGIGDPLVRGSIELYQGFGAVRSMGFDLFVKPPIATIESGLGTGAWDVGAGGSAALSLGRGYLFADLSYWRLGDMPDLALRENVGYGLALGLPLRDGAWSAFASLSGSTVIVDNMDPPATAGISVSYSPRLGRSLSMGVYAGLTESAPALSISAGWNVTARRQATRAAAARTRRVRRS